VGMNDVFLVWTVSAGSTEGVLGSVSWDYWEGEIQEGQGVPATAGFMNSSGAHAISGRVGSLLTGDVIYYLMHSTEISEVSSYLNCGQIKHCKENSYYLHFDWNTRGTAMRSWNVMRDHTAEPIHHLLRGFACHTIIDLHDQRCTCEHLHHVSRGPGGEEGVEGRTSQLAEG